jgi:hypothetical protein
LSDYYHYHPVYRTTSALAAAHPITIVKSQRNHHNMASVRRPLSLETRVFRIRRAHANPSYGRQYSSQHARRLLSRLEVDVTLSPGFLVPAALPRVRLYGEHVALTNQHATGNTGSHQARERIDLSFKGRHRAKQRLKKTPRSISKDPKPRPLSRLRVSWCHLCPGEDCVESLCDLDVEPTLEDTVPCASTGLSMGAFLDYDVTGLGSYALPSLRLVDTLHTSALNAGLDDCWNFLIELLVDVG